MYDGVTYIQISAPISSGSSGGAVIDGKGKVVGVSSAGFRDGQNLNLAMPINLVKAMPREQLISFRQFQGATGTTPTSPPSGNAMYYTDNPHVLDYGYCTGSVQMSVENAGKGVVIRQYSSNYAAYTAYIQRMQNIGYRITETKNTETSVRTYLRRGEDFVAVSVSPYSNVVRVQYYMFAK